jgi:hypothetical protein
MRRPGHNTADRERYVDTMEREGISRKQRQLYETLRRGDTSRLEASVPDVVRGALDSSVSGTAVPSGRRSHRRPDWWLCRRRCSGSPRTRSSGTRPTGRRGVRLLYAAEGDDVVILVNDQGPDITPTVGAGARRATPGGQRVEHRSDLALGLPFAREVLEVFDGILVVEDGTDHGGTAFTTRWPVSVRSRRTLT